MDLTLHSTLNCTVIRALLLKKITQGVLLGWYQDFLKVCWKYCPSNLEYCPHNFCYCVWVGTGSIIFILHLIVFCLSCVYIWTHIIVTKKDMSPFDSCGTYLSVGLTRWPISSSPDIRIIYLFSLQLMAEQDVYQELSSDTCILFLRAIVLITGLVIIFLYQTLIDIIVVAVCVIWASGVLWLHWSSKVWKEKSRGFINNESLRVNTTPFL